MSMIGNYKCIRPDRFEDLRETIRRREDPEAVRKFLHPDERTFEPAGPKLNIGKSRHGIHFLLNGDAWEENPPLGNVTLGGIELGNEDLGYGPARYLTPPQVQEVADVLKSLDRDTLRTRFCPEAFTQANIYPRCWSEEHAGAHFDWLWDNLTAIRDFFHQAAQYGDAMLLYLNQSRCPRLRPLKHLRSDCCRQAKEAPSYGPHPCERSTGQKCHVQSNSVDNLPFRLL